MVLKCYLKVTAGLAKICEVKAIVAVADGELGDIFGAVWTSLNGNPCDVADVAQINDQVLAEIGTLRRP